jgi:hypothetical protein
MASGKTHVAAMLSDVGAVLSSTLLPQMAVQPLWSCQFGSVWTFPPQAHWPLTVVCESEVL